MLPVFKGRLQWAGGGPMVKEGFGGLRYEHDKFLCRHRTDVAIN